MVVLCAPAKLTVSLRILGVRDDGMHLVDAEMLSVSLCDTLRVERRHDGEPNEIVMSGPASRGLDEIGDDNLVARALRLAGRSARVEVDKQIPAGAGLGGGSSDAAAILRWAGIGDQRAAAGLGADVAFCLSGGRARVTGIGDIIEPIAFQPRTFTLLSPPIHCSTPAVYRRWDDLGGPVDPGGNDLVAAALDVYPELSRWRDELAAISGQSPRLAGSGATWFVEGSFRGSGRQVVEALPAAMV